MDFGDLSHGMTRFVSRGSSSQLCRVPGHGALFLTGCYWQPIRVVYPIRRVELPWGAERGTPWGGVAGSRLGACVGLHVSLGSAD